MSNTGYRLMDVLNHDREVIQRITALLRGATGSNVRVVDAVPIADGWTATVAPNPWPMLTRCLLDGDANFPSSVVVKRRRPASETRSEPARFADELAALGFLTALTCDCAPRLLAADAAEGMLVMEDLASGVVLDELLVGNDPAVAEQGVVTFAAALGRMHATTAGHAPDYYALRRRYGSVDPHFDRVSILTIDISEAWQEVKGIVQARPTLPSAAHIERDVAAIIEVLAEPGPYLAFSNGDTCPANCRLTGDGCRFVDFEHAAFRHALIDVAGLRLPFPACPCWSRFPRKVSERAEAAYRAAFAPACPAVLDSTSYARGLAAACVAWTLVRLRRLPKLEANDAPHPMGFSRRGQLLDTIAVTVETLLEADCFSLLTNWLSDMAASLRRTWPDLPRQQRYYPAFER